jgi:hypothetical protein
VLEGHSYSFAIEGTSDPCANYRLRTWAHNSDQIDGGVETCQSAQEGNLNDYRVWHDAGEPDAIPCPSNEQTAPIGFDRSMPTGWLMVRNGPAGRFVYTDINPPNDPPDCAFTAPGYGVEAADWRPWPTQPSQDEYVCRFAHYTPRGETTQDGWYWGKPYWPNRNGAPRDVYLRLDTATDATLLTKYTPELLFDQAEQFFADWPGAITDDIDNYLRRDDGSRLAGAGTHDTLSLDLLAFPEYSNGSTSRSDDRLVEGDSDYVSAAERFHTAQGYGNTVVGRVVHDSDGHTWLQYWLWYYFNKNSTLGVGDHQGDWEFVQYQPGDDRIPSVATYAQHNAGESCPWSEVEKAATPDGAGIPVVYVALGSHASYFTPGDHQRPFPEPTDQIQPDYEHPVIPHANLVADDFPAWVTWRGVWGDTAGLTPSPPSPNQQGAKWSNPPAFNGSADAYTVN